MPQVIVEFYGIPRARAGRPDLSVEAATMTQAMEAIRRACPGLTDLTGTDSQLSPHYLVSLNGRRFVGDLNAPLRDGDWLLLMSADAGG